MSTEVSGQVFGPQGSREGGLFLTIVCSRTKKASDREPEFPAYTPPVQAPGDLKISPTIKMRDGKGPARQGGDNTPSRNFCDNQEKHIFPALSLSNRSAEDQPCQLQVQNSWPSAPVLPLRGADFPQSLRITNKASREGAPAPAPKPVSTTLQPAKSLCPITPFRP